MRSRDALIIGAALAALVFWPRRASAAINPGADVSFPPAAGWWDAPDSWTPSVDYFDPVYDAPEDYPEVIEPVPMSWELEQLGLGLPDFSTVDNMELADDPQIQAFSYAIRRSEHNAADVASGADYATFYGGDRFTNMSDHPVNTGEMRGVPLPAAMCIAAGFPSGRCVSTAAGGYQMIRPTWNRLRAQEPRLPDFSPRSQDIAAARLLRELGVHRLLRAGDLQGAIYRASSQWASLPGSTAKQGGRTLAFVVDAYRQAGGVA